MRDRARANPSIREIVDYWSARKDESDLAVDWSEAHERCWRCGYRSKLQKCHVIPGALGGPNTAENLVLLCGRCHHEAPNHQDPQYLWAWLRATCVSFYDTYWTYRAYEEFETMFGRKPFSWVVGTSTLDEEELHDQYRTLFRSEYDRVVTHFGQGRLNPATLACLIAEIERAIASQHGVALPASSERHMNNRFFQLVTTGT